MRILALGDSYTIGESIPSEGRWPEQLARRLRTAGLPTADPLIIARTGWTTAELQAGIAQVDLQAEQGPFDLVTLLIGVNNQYRGGDPEIYRQEFSALLGLAVQFAGGEPGRVIVLSIPDWGVTPFAQLRHPARIAAEIDAFNAINRAASQSAGAAYIDITPISRRAASDPSLLAPDGLHPSVKMYSAWVDLLLPVALDLLH
jgi:lysophospholipase L1-like esterase